MTRKLQEELKSFIKIVYEHAENRHVLGYSENQWVSGRAKQLLKKLNKKDSKN